MDKNEAGADSGLEKSCGPDFEDLLNICCTFVVFFSRFSIKVNGQFAKHYCSWTKYVNRQCWKLRFYSVHPPCA